MPEVSEAGQVPAKRENAAASSEAKKDRAFLAVILALTAAYVALFLTLSLYRYANLRGSSFDTAIFSQVIWLLSRFKGATSTIRGVNLFGDHMAPILFLLLPLYWVRGNAPALLAAQTVALGLGALPLYLLGRKRLESRWLALALAVAYLSYPALEHMNLFDFHPESLGVCFLLFAVLAIEKKKHGWFYLMCLLAAVCKEDMVLAVLLLGILVYFRYDRRAGKVVAISAAGYFMVSVFFIIPGLSPAGYQYSGRLRSFGDSPLEAARNMLIHPRHTMEVLATRQNLRYALDLLLPVGFLCLLAPTWLIPALPAFAINIISDFAPQHTIIHQYTASIIPFVFIAAVFGLRKILNWSAGAAREPAVRGALALVLLGCALTANFYMSPSPLGADWSRNAYRADRHVRALKQGLEEIPEGAPVSAQIFMLAHLSDRKGIYLFPSPFVNRMGRRFYDSLGEDYKKIAFPGLRPGDREPEVDYVALDANSEVWPLTRRQHALAVKLLQESGDYRSVYEKDGVTILRRRDSR